jgi:hypothetical protein
MKYKINWSKFKGTTKLPAQPSPSRFSAMQNEFLVAEKAREKFGDLPEFMGLSTKSTQRLSAESYAGKVENRMFFKTLFKERKSSRLKTADFIKKASSNVKATIRPKKVTPKFVVPKIQFYKSDIQSRPSKLIKGTNKKTKAFDPILRFPKQAGETITGKSKIVAYKGLRIAKSKGALGAYKTADIKGQQAFSKIVEKYTSQAKSSSFKVRSKPTKSPMDYREKAAYRQTVSTWGKDPDIGPDFNTDIMSGSSKRFTDYKFKKGQGPFASLATKKYIKKKK